MNKLRWHHDIASSAPSSFLMDEALFYAHGECLMLDLAFIRNNPDVVKEAARVKNNPIDIDALLALDQRVLALQHEIEEARSQQNKLNKEIQNAAREKNTDLRNALIAEGKGLAERLKEKEPQLSLLQEERYQQ